ncbi:MAG: hypothetical protein ACE5FB_07140, partial [Candidatus Binatia bacterium]
MLNKKSIIMAILGAGLMTLATQAVASDNRPGERCKYQLTTTDVGIANVRIKDDRLRVKIHGARPDTLYTVWVDFRNRESDELPDDYPDQGIERGVAPAFASTAGVTAGVGLDPNGIITDDDGDAKLRVKLDYNLLEPGASPVVGTELA